ncbi:MAG TPA: carboxypeptidase-like regulatory domain-containing protein [Chitinophagaceae bacterium]|nr:carboxypeptidase-like regulatory domain-containing protein [Chitinophagaceae bacterium]
MKKLFLIILSFILFPLLLMGQQKADTNALVEVSGVVMTSDSLMSIPNVTVYVVGADRGLVANEKGLFSIVARRGDSLAFSVVGFKKRKINVPLDLKQDHMSLAVLLKQDTAYLPLMVVHSYPSKEEFEEAFLHWDIPDDYYQLAKANTASDILESRLWLVPTDGGEGVRHTFQKQFERMRTTGQVPTMNIFNPLAWAEFIKSLTDKDKKKD